MSGPACPATMTGIGLGLFHPSLRSPNAQLGDGKRVCQSRNQAFSTCQAPEPGPDCLPRASQAGGNTTSRQSTCCTSLTQAGESVATHMPMPGTMLAAATPHWSTASAGVASALQQTSKAWTLLAAPSNSRYLQPTFCCPTAICPTGLPSQRHGFSQEHTCASPQQQRAFSVQPENVVYAGPTAPNPSRVTLRTLRKKYDQGQPLAMLTAYDYPSAVHVDTASADILLVGDSVGMVVHGHDTTLPVTLDDMLMHCKAVARGARRAFLVGDLPFGSYETGVRDAVRAAVRMLKEGGMDAVKLEGGSPARVEAARAIVEAGVAVMGHVGLTPQSVSVIGGFRPQAQVAEEALRVLKQAQALQAAGCFAVVLECIPGPIAAAITASLRIPTIGIGAGPACSGQVLVYHDLLGMMSHPHHAKVTPKFCKQYAHVGETIQAALQQYCQEVTQGTFPSHRFSPYRIPEAEVTALCSELETMGMAAAADAVRVHARDAKQAKEAAAMDVAGSATPAAAPATGGGGGGSGSARKPT